MFRTHTSTALLACIALAACASGSSMEMRSASEGTISGSASTPALTDANIAAIVLAANRIDVENGELALRKSQNPEIRKFAQTMVTDHNGVNRAAVELATKLGLTPVPNETSIGLTRSADETRAMLATKSGAEFDRAYIANEVAYHKTVLGAVDAALIPGASNAELKALLERVRPAFVAHLAHAEQVSEAVGN